MGKMKILAFTLLGLFCLTLAGHAGEMSSDLAEKLATISSSEKVSVIIAIGNSLTPQVLKKKLKENYKTFALRHRNGIAQLKSEALIRQSGPIDLLQKMQSSGLADNIKSHWLINVITADVAASEMANLAARSDVSEIFQMPEITTLGLSDESSIETSTESMAGVESNLKVIGADSAWKEGYTGEGRVVCSFDTGVQGDHPALSHSWKGLDGNTAAAWFDPMGGQSFPHYIGSSGTVSWHGTHTMGTMVGHDDITGDTVGVAPDARWISAAVIDIAGASIIDAFEWAADPDGDPNTIDDVPDVINHSWGVNNSSIGCNDYFWQMIDNTEALGIINIFAAGNFGNKDKSIANPANRALDSLDCFAVGNINDSTLGIVSNSSRGPSDCDNISIKPNVVAPGFYIRSSVPVSVYKSDASGTSMAAPHVSGAVAILRQKSPNATPDEIKEALLRSCQPLPTADSSPNNTYGWGLINIPAALAYLDSLPPVTQPDLRIFSYDYLPVNPGDTARGYVYIKNLGSQLADVFGEVTGGDDALEILTNHLDFGFIHTNDISGSDVSFDVAISDTVTPGSMLAVDLTLCGTPGYSRMTKLFIQVGPVPRAGYYTHQSDLLRFSISNLGQYGLANGSMMPLGFSGFRYIDTTINELYEGAFMIGTDSLHVSDGARNIVEEPDNDFAVSPGGDLITNPPGTIADAETFSIMNDSKAANPIGLEIVQKTYNWSGYPDNNYAILEYDIKNAADTAINGLYAGLFFDWDIYNYGSNRGGFSSPENLGYMYYYYYGGGTTSKYRGLSVITPEGAVSFKLRAQPPSAPYSSFYFRYPESEKYSALASGIIDTAGVAIQDLAEIISSGPFGLDPGESAKVAFAVVAADNLADLQATALRAKNKYYNPTDVATTDPEILPESFTLAQNYPNPFNPSTIISFTLRVKSKVKLSIYNILGERVVDLLDDELPGGMHQIHWNGRDRAGKETASGIYFCRLSSGGNFLTKKMALLK